MIGERATSKAREAYERGWRWEAQVAGRRVARATAATVEYSPEGAATFSLQTDVDLRGLERAPVRVLCGWGRADTLQFEGTLGSAVRDPFTGDTYASSYGVLGAMARQYFDHPTDFSGWTVAAFFRAINDLLHDRRAAITVKDGGGVLQEADFGGEATLSEAASSVVEPFDLALQDRPGFDLLVSPKPRPAVGSRGAWEVGPRDHGPGALEINPALEGPWAKVVAFRRGEDPDDPGGDGGEVELVRAEAKIDNPGPFYPRPNEIYWIPEYPGTQAGAERTVAGTAAALAVGSFAGAVPGISALPGVVPPAPGRVVRAESVRLGRPVLVSYAARLTETTLDLVAGLSDLGFAAVRESERRIREREPRVVVPSHVIRTPVQPFGVEPDGRPYFDDTDGAAEWFGHDGDGGLWVDPDLAPAGLAGREPDGKLWIDAEEGF